MFANPRFPRHVTESVASTDAIVSFLLPQILFNFLALKDKIRCRLPFVPKAGRLWSFHIFIASIDKAGPLCTVLAAKQDLRRAEPIISAVKYLWIVHVSPFLAVRNQIGGHTLLKRGVDATLNRTERVARHSSRMRLL